MRNVQKRRTILTVLLSGAAVAFALGVLVYVGGALLQTINVTHIPEPGTALSSALLGAILGLVGSIISRKQIQ